jgi:hypothetical protein
MFPRRIGEYLWTLSSFRDLRLGTTFLNLFQWMVGRASPGWAGEDTRPYTGASYPGLTRMTAYNSLFGPWKTLHNTNFAWPSACRVWERKLHLKS